LFTQPPVSLCATTFSLVMDRSAKKEIVSPRQIGQRARDSISPEGNTNTSRDGVSPLHVSSAPPSMLRRSTRQGGSPLSLPSPVLDYARRTQMDAQAHRTSVRIAELGREVQHVQRNDAVTGFVQEELPVDLAYPGTAARKNVTVRRSRDRLSNRPASVPRTPDGVTRRRSMDRPTIPRSSEEKGLVMQGTFAVTHGRKHGEELQGSYPSARRDDNRRPYLLGRPVEQQLVDQWPWGGSKSPSIGSKSPSTGSEGEDEQQTEGGFAFEPEWGRWKDRPIETHDEDRTWGGTTEKWERNARAKVITQGGSPPPKQQSENLFVDGLVKTSQFT
jgi:hypothetical protein